MSPRLSAKIFVGLILVVIPFQFGLALGAPWGRIAMGGGFADVLPPPLRWAAMAQIVVLSVAALVVLDRVGWGVTLSRRPPRWAAWSVVALFAVSVLLNAITPSGWERAIWLPVALGLFLTALHVARSPRA